MASRKKHISPRKGYKDHRRSLNAYGVTRKADHDAVYRIVGDSPNMVWGERRIASSDYAKHHRAAAKGYKKWVATTRAQLRSPKGNRY